MSQKHLHLFPDTNVFIQCKGLSACDWGFLSDFDGVSLIVSRPVQREIDRQKNQRTDRVGKRAREVASVFRELLTAGPKVIREASPRVTLSIDMAFNYAGHRPDVLNLDEPDDQLIACVLDCAEKQPDWDARVLTDDGGPMATAALVGAKCLPVPENWKLPPEASNDEKKLQELQRENSRLRAAEPVFEVKCLNAGNDPIERVSVALSRRAALTETELDDLVSELELKFPLVTDFERQAAAERDPLHKLLGAKVRLKHTYVPPDDATIQEYAEDKYPSWRAACRKVLSKLHKRPVFTTCQLSMSNTGTRPAINAKIGFVAHGNFFIRPGDVDDEDDENEPQAAPRLPAPPKPPEGEWVLEGLSGAKRSFDQLSRQLGGLPLTMERPLFTPPVIPEPRRPESFYYGPGLHSPGRSYELNCQRWRHGSDAEIFLIEIHPRPDAEIVEGALEYRIHADNLSQPVGKLVPVRIDVKSENLLELARLLMNDVAGVDHSKSP